MVADYQMERLIGRGSYGEVWLARTALGTLRAVKVVYRDSFDSERPYLREFAGIRAYEPISSHESQVSVFHVGKNDEAGYFYYVMELADDAASLVKAPSTLPLPETSDAPPPYAPATLSVLLKQRGRLPCAEALPLARSLASALDRLHGHGLVHRDIKPANIIFVEGRPKLADIGLVTSAAKADTLVGTTGYIPPEGPGTAAADLFSFGKVLYEVVTGHDRQEFPMLPDDLGQLPDRDQLLEVNEIILKCCHMDPRERYASGADVLADLKRIEAGHSLRRDRARRRQLAVAACVLVVVLGGLGVQHFREQARLGKESEPAGAKARPVQLAQAKVAEPEGRWTNSLGMVFASIPGLPVQFSIWETRVQDYEQFARATRRSPTMARSSVRGRTNLVSWSSPAELKPAPDHAVRLVTWDDANAFCLWLTERERATGWLREGESYRLPMDLEWSWAAGLTNETGSTPVERHSDGSQTNVFYWGTNWPPPDGAGNFSDENSVMFQHIAGYLDPFPGIAPVGSFPAERHGLFDLAGNVSEWCGDELVERAKGGSTVRVSRGAAYDNSGQTAFRITRRMMTRAEIPSAAIGFRVVRVALPGRVQPPVAVAAVSLVPEPPAAPAPRPAAFPKDTRTNSLGMVFVPVAGLTAEFSIWETRIRDFRAFVETTKHQADVGTFQETLPGNKRVIVERRWHEDTVAANPDWPIRAISPRDALAFCAWLTAHERTAGLLPTNLCYRLPRDHEWSWAAGLTNEVGTTSLERLRSTGPGRFQWGTNWPPPLGAGNFSGTESILHEKYRIPGYRDDFPTVGPVGSFPPEANGLFDLAGNVSEICEEWPPAPGVEPRFPRRGASFDRYEPEDFEVRYRRSVSLKHSSVHAGFRVVCAPVDDDRVPGR